jgi:hypothetical protein
MSALNGPMTRLFTVLEPCRTSGPAWAPAVGTKIANPTLPTRTNARALANMGFSTFVEDDVVVRCLDGCFGRLGQITDSLMRSNSDTGSDATDQ